MAAVRSTENPSSVHHEGTLVLTLYFLSLLPGFPPLRVGVLIILAGDRREALQPPSYEVL